MGIVKKESPKSDAEGDDKFLANADDDSSVDLTGSESSEFEKFYHPNHSESAAGSKAPKKKKSKHAYKGCAKYLHRFDELIMRPIFIYRYEKKMQ